MVLIEKEDRYPGRIDQFLYLGLARAVLRARVPVRRGLANAMCLVADQRVQAVSLCGHEAVEVLEQFLDFALAGAGHLAHGLRERCGTCRVESRPALPVQLAEQRQSDDALARPWATGDHDDLLVVGASGPVHRTHDYFVRDSLFVEQNELLTVAHLSGGYGDQLLGRADLSGEELIG